MQINAIHPKIPQLRFRDFSGDWEEKKLGDIGVVTTGNTPSTSNRNFYGGLLMFVSPSDITDKRFVVDTKTKLTELGFQQGRKIQKDSILFVCIGSTIGKLAQVRNTCVTNQQINAIRTNDNNLNNFEILIKNSK